MNYIVNGNVASNNENLNENNDFCFDISASPSSLCSSTKSFGSKKRKLPNGFEDCIKFSKKNDDTVRTNNGFNDTISGYGSSINSDECENIVDNINDDEKPSTSNKHEDNNIDNDNKTNINGTKKPPKFNDDLYCEHGIHNFLFLIILFR